MLNRIAWIRADHPSKVSLFRWIVFAVNTVLVIFALILFGLSAHTPMNPLQGPPNLLPIKTILRRRGGGARWPKISVIMTRCVVVTAACIDVALNWYFVKLVRKELIMPGMMKYERVTRFNIRIVFVSLLMDVS